MKAMVFLFGLMTAASCFAAPSLPELSVNGADGMLEFYRDAASHGTPRAMLALAWYNEHGIGMPTNRAEALRWYRNVLSSPGGAPKNIIEAAEDGFLRLGGETVGLDASSANGNRLLDFIAAQTNRSDALLVCNAMRQKLLGKTLVFTNLVAGYVQRRKDGGIKLSLEVPEESRVCKRSSDRHAFYPYDYGVANVCVFFGREDAQLARCLDRNDRLVRLTAQVVTNWTWQSGIAVKGLSFEPLDRSLTEPLPAFDAATIDGDGLLDFIRSRGRVRKWQFSEIQSKLTGRRLTFHKLRLNGSTGSIGGAFDSTFNVGAVPFWERVGEGDAVGSAKFRLAFADDASRLFALWLVRTDSFMLLDEVTGTFSRVDDPDAGWALQLEDVSLVPKNARLKLSDDGAGPVDGDEVVRSVGANFAEIDKLMLCMKFGGREIAFASGVIESCQSDGASNSLSVVCRMGPESRGANRANPLRVAFAVPADKAEALRRTPIAGDLLFGIKGRLAPLPPVKGEYYRHSGFSNRHLKLEQPDFSIAWKSDVVKTNGLETKTGERIVRRLCLCWPEVREDQFRRLARKFDGKIVDFQRARSGDSYMLEDGTVVLEAMLEDPLLGDCVRLSLLVPKTSALAHEAGIAKRGLRLAKIRGVLATTNLRRNQWGADTAASVCLKDVSFEIADREKDPSAAK